jgi:hypothetical protein
VPQHATNTKRGICMTTHKPQNFIPIKEWSR